jgi:hypothetical protein
MSWRPEILQDNGKWHLSGLRFPTKNEAETYLLDLPAYWRKMIYHKVSASEDPVNYLWRNGGLMWVNDLPPWGVWDLVL